MEGKFLALMLLAAMVAMAAGASTDVLEQTPKFRKADGDEEFYEEMTQLAVFEEDDIEIAYLEGDKKIFADFCIRSRDSTRVYLKNNMNQAAMKVFNVMFNSIEDLELEYDMSLASPEAVKQGAEILEASVGNNPEVVPTSTAQIERNIDDNVDKVRKTSMWTTLTESVRVVVNTIIETVMSETAKRLAILKAQFNGENVRDGIKKACMDISMRLKTDLEGKLSNNKKDLLKLDLSPELAAAISATKIDDVGCVTTSRVSKVARFCDTLNAVGPIIFNMFGL